MIQCTMHCTLLAKRIAYIIRDKLEVEDGGVLRCFDATIERAWLNCSLYNVEYLMHSHSEKKLHTPYNYLFVVFLAPDIFYAPNFSRTGLLELMNINKS
jgi:hypothetical protein